MKKNWKPLSLQDRNRDTAPEFRCKIRRIAALANLDEMAVYALWREYEEQSVDQSAILFEFIRWYESKLGGNRDALTSAIEDQPADSCEGRTIWNSEGTNGPCLICAPPEIAQR